MSKDDPFRPNGYPESAETIGGGSNTQGGWRRSAVYGDPEQVPVPTKPREQTRINRAAIADRNTQGSDRTKKK